MSLFLKTDKDSEGTTIRIEAGFRAKNGLHFLVLRRLPPHYPKPPVFVAELSSDPIEVRVAGRSAIHHKAYAIQGFSTKELHFLLETAPGPVRAPLLSMRYPHVIKYLGKSFERLTEDEIATLVQHETLWKLVGGQR